MEVPDPAAAIAGAPGAAGPWPYVETGEGDAIVLVHGALGDLRTLAPVLPHLASHGRAMTYSQRGFGTGACAGPPLDVPFGTAQQADDLLAFLDARGLARAHIVAWSFSAHSALAAAVHHPHRVASLCVYDLGFPTFITDTACLDALAAEVGPVFAAIGDALQSGGPLAAAEAMIDASGGPGTFAGASDGVQGTWRDNAHTLPLLFRQTPPVPLSADDLAALRVPTTIGWGEGSGAYRTVSRIAAGLVPGARAVEVPAAGHLWPQQSPAGFAQFITTHLEAT